MKKTLLLLMMTLTVLLSPICIESSAADDVEPILITKTNGVKDQYLVILRDDAPRGVETGLLASAGSEAEHIVTLENGIRAVAMKMPEAKALALLNHPYVARIEQNARGSFSGSPQQTGADLWHLDEIDERNDGVNDTPGYYHWNADGTGVDIYIVDSGIMATHNEFGGRVTPGGNFVVHLGDYSPPNDPCEDPNTPGNDWTNSLWASHGTGVAATAAGTTLGVAKGATIIPVKVAPCKAKHPITGELGEYGDPDLIATAWGLDWILAQANASQRKAVVNMSIYFPEDQNNCYNTSGDRVACNCVDDFGNPVACTPALEHNIDQLLQAGVTVVASANNQGGNYCSGSSSQSPARMGYGGTIGNGAHPARVITVGGTAPNNQLWPQSNSGPCVSIYAPAQLQRVAHTSSNTAERSSNTWGTSFSAPIVAGAAARILQDNPAPDLSYRDYRRPYKVWTILAEDSTKQHLTYTTPGDEKRIYVKPTE